MIKKSTRNILYAFTFCVLFSLFYRHYANVLLPKNKLNPAQNIIINAVPKSASEYIAAKLEKSLNYDRKRISAEYIPRDQVNFSALRSFYSTGGNITKQHLDASNLNVKILKRYTDRIVLHVRDPREVNEQQKQKIGTIVPDKLLKRFNWEK